MHVNVSAVANDAFEFGRRRPRFTATPLRDHQLNEYRCDSAGRGLGRRAGRAEFRVKVVVHRRSRSRCEWSMRDMRPAVAT